MTSIKTNDAGELMIFTGLGEPTEGNSSMWHTEAEILAVLAENNAARGVAFGGFTAKRVGEIWAAVRARGPARITTPEHDAPASRAATTLDHDEVWAKYNAKKAQGAQ